MKNGAEFHERQAMVLLDQQFQAIGQFDFLDGMIGVAFQVGPGLWRGALGQQRILRAIFRSQVMAGDALNIGEGHLFDGGQIALRKIQVIGRKPVAAEILGLAFHGLAGRQCGGNELFHGLLQFGRKPREF